MNIEHKIRKNCGKQFKRIREKSGLKQEKFSEKINIAYRTWQRIERNGTNSIEMICYLAEALNFDLIEFLKEAIDKK